jgi:hypothetical protein
LGRGSTGFSRLIAEQSSEHLLPATVPDVACVLRAEHFEEFAAQVEEVPLLNRSNGYARARSRGDCDMAGGPAARFDSLA